MKAFHRTAAVGFGKGWEALDRTKFESQDSNLGWERGRGFWRVALYQCVGFLERPGGFTAGFFSPRRLDSSSV